MTSRAETTRDQQAAGRNRASRPVVVERYLRVQVRKETAGTDMYVVLRRLSGEAKGPGVARVVTARGLTTAPDEDAGSGGGRKAQGPQKPGASEMYPFPRQGERETELAAAWDQVCVQRFPRPFEGNGMRRHGLQRCRVAALLGKTAGQ
ncbi:hypothetical protein MYCTH_2125134 [Thermothelomyces thermophilus ATCC 42464]|uniref:Uncharacterized protein n=1 Tax=Thermothelomyces thermophilus (strain ATCC 42464 / BCRC 31852 / DSM 1799) TaxID=573729 RepID=G2Q870_THET4|nr:uncharacterized protein MYCTH_2125134 [Thermothelomyces thermophilus ATCC 42464]AEO56173.1 hypothetical protein MYCTH_2125134 [Thermothelomyces thermophilus ATCC 42464]